MQEHKPKKPIPLNAWKPGQSGNPSGRPKLPEDLAASKRLSRLEFDRILHKYLFMEAFEVKQVLEEGLDQDGRAISMIEMMVAGLLCKAAMEGCTNRMDFVLLRLFGRTGFHEPLPDSSLPVGAEPDCPTFIVEIKDNGKFVRQRPRELAPAEVQKLKGG